MYEEHPVFEPPHEDAVLWRYMDFTKFVSLLDAQSLFFSRADRLGDPFEGSYSKANIALRPALYQGTILQFAWETLAPFYQAMRQFTLINCWHEANHESAAMWRLYSRDNDGIAIRTTFNALTQSFTCNDTIFIGKVNYIDYAADHFLRVARKEIARARVEVPLRVSQRALLDREGPLGPAWRSLAGSGPPNALEPPTARR